MANLYQALTKQNRFDIGLLRRAVLDVETSDGYAELQEVLQENNAVHDFRSDTPVVEANNALLRALSRLMSVDKAILTHYQGSAFEKEAVSIRKTLKKAYADLVYRILSAANARERRETSVDGMGVDGLEKAFNTKLVVELHAANLLQDVTSKKAVESALGEITGEVSQNNQVDMTDIDFLQYPSQLALAEYGLNYEQYQALLINMNHASGTEAEKKLYAQGKVVLNQVNDVFKAEERIDSKTLGYLNEVLAACSRAINEPKDKANLEKIAHLSEVFSSEGKHLGWQDLSQGLCLFIGLALIVAGALAAIPTGGIGFGGVIAGIALISADIGPDVFDEGTEFLGEEMLEEGLEGREAKSKSLASEMKLFKHELEEELDELPDEPEAEDDEGGEGEGDEHPNL